MSHKQKTLFDIIKMMNTEIRLSNLSCFLFICSLFMPFIGFHIDNPLLIILAGGERNISINGIEVISGYNAALAMLAAGFSMAARRSPNLFAYKNIIDGLCFAVIFFILIYAWVSNPIKQVIDALIELSPESKQVLSQVGYTYPSIGVFMLIASGICLFFADKKS